MIVPAMLVASYVIAPAWLATVIGEPTTARDAAILGVGSQGFVLGFIGRAPA
jgi:hypothetical protein